MQVWTVANGLTNPVVELRNGERLLAAPAVAAHPGATWANAVFGSVPAGEWIVTLRGSGAAPETLHVMDRSRELHDLSRDEAWMRKLAGNSGGSYTAFTDAGRILNNIQPHSRVERLERVWRLWDSPWILSLLVLMLTLEWVWRKLAGLV